MIENDCLLGAIHYSGKKVQVGTKASLGFSCLLNSPPLFQEAPRDCFYKQVLVFKQEWYCIIVISAARRLRQEDYKLEIVLEIHRRVLVSKKKKNERRNRRKREGEEGRKAQANL